MADPRIASLEAEIARYVVRLNAAGTPEMEKMWADLITSTRTNLHDLMQQQQQQQQPGKHFIVLFLCMLYCVKAMGGR